MKNIVKVWQTGKINYGQSLKLQKYLADMHHKNIPMSDTILLVEHPPVYTIGIRTKDYTIEDEALLKQKGAEFYRTNRGGLITFHGPGQLVVYPILNLKHFRPSMRWYVEHIEKTIITLCHKFELQAQTSPYTGVWINDKKVCAIGVHGSRFITTHGLALNCCTDLKWFDNIVPCGIEGKGVTSLSEELGRVITTENAVSPFIDSFSKVFNCTVVDYPENEKCDIMSLINKN